MTLFFPRIGCGIYGYLSLWNGSICVCSVKPNLGSINWRYRYAPSILGIQNSTFFKNKCRSNNSGSYKVLLNTEMKSFFQLLKEIVRQLWDVWGSTIPWVFCMIDWCLFSNSPNKFPQLPKYLKIFWGLLLGMLFGSSIETDVILFEYWCIMILCLDGKKNF